MAYAKRALGRRYYACRLLAPGLYAATATAGTQVPAHHHGRGDKDAAATARLLKDERLDVKKAAEFELVPEKGGGFKFEGKNFIAHIKPDGGLAFDNRPPEVVSAHSLSLQQHAQIILTRSLLRV